MARDRLVRDMDNAMLGGVCAGIAKRYTYDVTVVRLAWLLVAIFSGGLGVLLYIATWIVMPRPEQLRNDDAAATSGTDAGDVLSPGERIAESARVLARAARTTAEEISEIARGRAAPGAGGSQTGAPGAVPAEQPSVHASPPPTDEAARATQPQAGDLTTEPPAASSAEPVEGVVPPEHEQQRPSEQAGGHPVPDPAAEPLARDPDEEHPSSPWRQPPP